MVDGNQPQWEYLYWKSANAIYRGYFSPPGEAVYHHIIDWISTSYHTQKSALSGLTT